MAVTDPAAPGATTGNGAPADQGSSGTDDQGSSGGDDGGAGGTDDGGAGGTDGGAGGTDDGGAGRPPEWSELPGNVRTAVIAIAARALGEIPVDQIPAALVPVARFTPAKRARLGAGPLARALEHDSGFRALAAQHLPAAPAGDHKSDGDYNPAADRDPGGNHDPAADRDPGGNHDPAADHDPSGHHDPVHAAARAFLLRLPQSAASVAAAARADEVATLRSQVAELTAAVDKLTARLARLTASRGPDAAGGKDAYDAGSPRADPAELDRLRRRLREQGSRVKAAEDRAEQAVAAATAERDQATAHAERERASAENWRARAEQEAHRADRARQALDRVREQAGQQRADTDRRIQLLLGTIEQAATGLRHEWQLASGGAEPADVLARDLPEIERRRRRSVDPPLLLDWLGLPHAHLIVDGYNVTKTGYPELSLADQRDRLTRSLAALAARTGAEVTVVFDGAAVVAAAPSFRGVRVMFSPPDVIADEVIRRLAAAEPRGRVVVVVSSDREVVDGVRRSGARTAPSAVLLTVLG